jgi:hypothetical protein
MFRTLKLTLLLGCLTVFATVSCHKDGGSDGVKPQNDAALAEIRWLELEDPDCVNDKDKAGASAESVTTYQWNGEKINESKISLSASTGSDSEFTTSNIIGTILNLKKSYDCKLDSSGERTCTSRSIQQDETKVLKLCRPSMQYERDSLEAVAITSHAIVEDAYRFYQTLADTVAGLPKSIMVVQPRIERQYSKKNGDKINKYDADNAAFTSIELGKPASKYGLMLIYPSKKDSFAESGVNLWEVPFVLKHEFGHHVFHHYVKDSDSSDTASLDAISDDRLSNIGLAPRLSASRANDISGILPSERSRIPRHDGFNLTSNATAALDGINETFADLFAYFAQESAANQVNLIKCLDKSRDPKSPRTRLGRLKELSTSYVDMYEGRKSALDQDDCGEPSFDDSHDIAMMMGYPLAKFIETATPNGVGKDRARHLINWAKEIQRVSDQSSSSVSLDTLVRALVVAVKPNVTSSDFVSACGELTAKITGLPLATASCK